MKYYRKKPLPEFPDKVSNPKKGGKKKRFALVWKFLNGKCWEQKYATRSSAETAKKEWEHKAKYNTTWFPPESCEIELVEL